MTAVNLSRRRISTSFSFTLSLGTRPFSCLTSGGSESALPATVISVLAERPGRPFLSEIFDQCSAVSTVLLWHTSSFLRWPVTANMPEFVGGFLM